MIENSRLIATATVLRLAYSLRLGAVLLVLAGALCAVSARAADEGGDAGTSAETSAAADAGPSPDADAEPPATAESAEQTPSTTEAAAEDDSSEEPAEDDSSEEPAEDDSSEEPAESTPDTEEAEIAIPWGQRVLDLEEQMRMGLLEVDAADTLYRELAGELWTFQEEVYAALRSRSADALDKRAQLATMESSRVRLLDSVTPELRRQLMGGGSRGMRELRREYANAKLDFFFQALAIPRGIQRILDGAIESPLDDLWRVLQLLFGVIVFRSWRRWAKKGLPALREQILEIRPRTDVHVQTARLIWYVQRFRAPLEWLGLLFFASAIFEAGDLEEVAMLVWVIVLWMLLTRFGLLLVDALAAQSVDGPRDQNPRLRLRSLRLIAFWILLTGLGLDLTSRYVGEAAIHTWATRAFTLLLVPILFLLLHWWRKPIIRRLKADASFSKTAARMGKSETGLGSYVHAAAGVIYVFGATMLQWAIRLASHFDRGRKIVATLLRREVERDKHREQPAETRISEELVFKLLASDDSFVEGPFHDGIERLAAMAETGKGATVAVLAERGGGLSTFLRLLKGKIGDGMRIIDWTPSGPDRFTEALAEKFGLDRGADLLTELGPKLEAEGVHVVAVDNYHRLARPKMGGLAGMEEAAAIANAVRGNIFWIVTLTRASWPYINRMLGDRATLRELIELPAWSEEQLEHLFDKRCENAGIEPDYRRLVFPRQFDDGERTSLEERNRYGFRRVLWELSDGNPEVAIRLFADSLRELPTGRIIVRLPQPASSDQLNSSNRTTLLILKVLVEAELATIEDLQAAIQIPINTVNTALSHCIHEKWVEEMYGHYQVTWGAYRTVKRALIRRGLIAR